MFRFLESQLAKSPLREKLFLNLLAILLKERLYCFIAQYSYSKKLLHIFAGAMTSLHQIDKLVAI
ncbi:hypothetical protein D3C76_1659480 [compost metagenome]